MGRQIGRELFGPRSSAIDQPDFGHPRIGKGGYNGARRPAGAKDDGGASFGPPIRCAIAQILAKSKRIRIARVEAAVRLHQDGIDRTDTAGEGLHPVGDGERRLLVRARQIAAAKPERRQRPQRLCQMFGPHCERHIGAVDTALVEPEAVQGRRARMRDRPPHDPGKPGAARDPHLPPSTPMRRSGAENRAIPSAAGRGSRNGRLPRAKTIECRAPRAGRHPPNPAPPPVRRRDNRRERRR